MTTIKFNFKDTYDMVEEAKDEEDLIANMSMDDLLIMKDKYKSNKSVVKIIDGYIEKLKKAKGNSGPHYEDLQ